jgi:hypothetical protein
MGYAAGKTLGWWQAMAGYGLDSNSTLSHGTQSHMISSKYLLQPLRFTWSPCPAATPLHAFYLHY